MTQTTIESKFRKILLAGQRAKQLGKGARPRVQLENAKPTRIALEEIERGLIDFDYDQDKEAPATQRTNPSTQAS